MFVDAQGSSSVANNLETASLAVQPPTPLPLSSPMPPSLAQLPSCPTCNQYPSPSADGWWPEATVAAGIAASVSHLQALQPCCTLPDGHISTIHQYHCLMTCFSSSCFIKAVKAQTHIAISRDVLQVHPCYAQDYVLQKAWTSSKLAPAFRSILFILLQLDALLQEAYCDIRQRAMLVITPPAERTIASLPAETSCSCCRLYF